jgi:CRISPR/Cas system-associated exonuclease Cas4 (RecB family)
MSGKQIQQYQKPFAWSFSRYKAYEQCPAFYKFKHLERRPEPQGDAAAHGEVVHKGADDYVSGKLKQMPEELSKTNFQEDFQILRKIQAQCEQEWAFNAEWRKVDWFASDAWLRMKVDTHFLTEERKNSLRITTVNIIDFKTGKLREEHELQRSLYAIGGFIVYPDAKIVRAQHWYIDSGEIMEDLYSPKHFEQLQKAWLLRIKPMINDTRFIPRPGNYCRYCAYRKSNGGPCCY